MALRKKLLIAVFVASFGTSFQWFSLSVTNNIFELQQEWMNKTYRIHYHRFLNPNLFNWLWSIANSAILIGALIGAAFTNLLSERCGRKSSLLALGVLNTIGAVVTGLSYWINAFEVFSVGRFLIGLTLGAGTGIASIFISEIAPLEIRGSCGSFQQIMAAFGNLVSFIVTLPFLLGTSTKWYLAVGLPAIPALVQAVGFIFLPESPKHLIITNDNLEKGRQASIQYHGSEDSVLIVAELIRLQDEKRREKSYRFVDFLREPQLRRPMIIAIIMQIGVQLGGQGPLFVYSEEIIKNTGLSKTVAKYSSAGLGLANFLASFVALVLVDRLGRRMLLLGALWVRITSLVAVILLVMLSDNYNNSLPALSWSIIPMLHIFMAGSSITISLAIFVIPTEIFPQGPRSAALTLIGFEIWVLQLLTVFLYVPWQKLVGVAWSFLPFVLLMVGTVLYLHWKLPETKGLTVEEISRKFEDNAPVLLSNTSSPEMYSLLTSEEPINLLEEY